jgi:hypothetical protein
MSIPLSWLTPLNNSYPVQVICEVIIDPDGDNIKLDGFHNLRQALSIPVYSWELDPSYQSEMMFDDIYLDFYDLDEFFHPLTSRDGYKPFKQYTTGLYDVPTATSARLLGHSGVSGFDIFSTGDVVKFVSISDPTVSDTVQITSVDFYDVGSYTLQQIHFASLSGSYVANDIVTSQPLLGKTVEIRIRLSGQRTSGEYTVFRGIIREGFEWQNGSAILKLTNIYGLFMQSILKIHATSPTSIQRVTTEGVLDHTFNWTTKTGTGSIGGQLTYIDTDYQGGASYQDVWGDGTFIYCAWGTYGLLSYSVDGAGALTYIDTDDQGGTYYHVWGDGNFIYCACGYDGLRSYSVDGSGNLTHIDTDDQGGSYNHVWGDGTFIYCACGDDGIRSYSVDGSGNLTHIDTDDQGGTYYNIYSDGTFIYVSNVTFSPNVYSLLTYSVDGVGNLTFIDSYVFDNFYPVSIWSNGNYICTANNTDGVHTFSVDGSGILTHIYSDDRGNQANHIWGDGTHIFLANGQGGLLTYYIDSDGILTYLDSDFQVGVSNGVWGDGTFIYVSGSFGLMSYSINGNYNEVIIYPNANLGQWVVTFTSATAFKVTGPNTENKAGTTGEDFYDATDASDSQIKIPSGFWHGTPAVGDILTFNVSANFNNISVGSIIQELISNYGGLAAAYHSITTTALSDDSDKITWSFDSPITVGEAITLMLPHAMGNLYLDECVLKFERQEPSV